MRYAEILMTDLPLLPRAISLAVHELRTPVTVVSGYLRMVLKEQAGPLNDKQRHMLEEAERSCARINTLVSEMSDLGKLESKQITVASAPVDLAMLVSTVASNMHEGADRGIRIDTRGVDRPLMVSGDRVRLEAAIGALIHAALRERAEPGMLVVQCARVDDTDRKWAAVAIGDEPVVQALLENAQTAASSFDEWRGGLGLALPVGRRVIEAHGGALWSLPGDPRRAGSALRLPMTPSD